MNEKTLKGILMVLGVLIVVWGISVGAGMLRRGGPSADSGVAGALEGLSAETVTAITLTSPDDEVIRLERADGGWTADGYPADSTALSRLWGSLEEAVVGNVVATNPANHARMGVSTDSAWTVEFGTTAGPTTVLIGKTGAAYSSAYVRLPDEDEVVLAQGDLRGSLARGASDWKDKTILTVDTTRIARIVVERDEGENATLVRTDDGWTLGEDSVRQTAIDNFMREISRLTASGFKDPDTELFEGNERRLTVEDEDGNVLASVRFLGNETTQHAVVPDAEVVFEIQSWKAERLTPTPALARETDEGG